MYPRLIRESVEKWLNTRDVIIIYGARQTGKTTIITELLKKISGSLILNCEKINWRPGRKVKVPEVFRQKYKTEEMTLISPSTLYRLFETDF